MPLLPLTTGNSSQGHTNERPTLPPIRDLFRDELQRRPVTPQFSPSASLARLNVNDDDYPEPAGRYYHSSSSSYGKVLPPGCTCPDRFCPTHSASSSRSIGSSHLGIRDTHPYNSQRNYSSSRTKAHYSDDPHRRMNPQYSPEVPPSTNNRFLNEHRSQSMHSGSPPSLSITTFPRTRSMTQDDERTPIPVDRFSPSKGPPTSTLISINRYPPDDQITGAGKYECEYCGKGFNRPSSLKIHLNSHTGEKPFTCPVEGCGRSFSVLSNMRRHTRVHATTAGDAGHDEAQTYPISLSYTQKWEQRRDSSASISSNNSRSSHSLSSDGDD